MVQRGLVVVRRRDRFQLEFHGFIPGELVGRQQALFGKAAVFFLVGADEAYRAPNHSGLNLRPKLSFRLLPQIAEDAGDEVLQGDAPAENVRAFEAATGQERLQRLNQSALRLGRKVFLNGSWSGPGFDSVGAAVPYLFEVE